MFSHTVRTERRVERVEASDFASRLAFAGRLLHVGGGRFTGARQRHVAVLLDLGGPMGLRELLDHVGGDKASLLRSLESLKAQQLLDAVDVEGGAAPGRPSRMWSLTDTGRAAVDRPDADRAGQLRHGDVWVIASTGPGGTAGVEEALADGRLLARARWITRLEGESRAWLAVYAAEAGQDASGLVAALRGCADCASGIVSGVQTPLDFVDGLRAAERLAARYRPGADS